MQFTSVPDTAAGVQLVSANTVTEPGADSYSYFSCFSSRGGAGGVGGAGGAGGVGGAGELTCSSLQRSRSTNMAAGYSDVVDTAHQVLARSASLTTQE